ncbi:TasA family protein [Frisingicoccus sp.]|uniref:TasA family protein n=1 Tax=Frisingicoccus sp. TaxID=1918627 RepID=UPI00386672CC
MDNSKKTKKALYASVMSLVLCCVMLIGTTFAWFTDSATTGVNKIQAGTLDVELVDGQGNSLEGKALEFHDKEGKTNILWEPGATFETGEFKVKNNGSLALRYEIAINGIKVSDNKLMEVITFKVVNADGTDVSLDKDGFIEMLTPGASSSNNLKITATMKSSAGNAYQKESVENVSITVFATQAPYENDINGNTYDAAATTDKNVVYVTTPDELVKAFANLEAGATISLGADIDMTGKTINAVQGKSFTLNGNGKTISNLTSNQRALFVDHSGSGTYFFNDVTINNCSVDSTAYGEENGSGLFMGMSDTCSNASFTNCKVINCTVNATDWAGAFVGYAAGYGNDSDGPVYGHFQITNCTVEGGSIISSKGSVGTAIGHAGGNEATECTIDGLQVKNIVLTGEKSEKTGIVVGTAGNGATVINNVTYENVTGNYNTEHELYGRFAPAGTGTLTINGTVVK